VSLSQWVHTVRHLRARQVAGQLRRRAERIFEDPAALGRRPAPPFPGGDHRPRGALPVPPPGENSAEGLRGGRFAFLHRDAELSRPPDWDAPGLAALWRYNLHYFEWLWLLPYEDGRALASEWIAGHAPARARIGWDPYPISLRLGNWCAYFFGRHAERLGADPAFRGALWASIHRQASWLARHTETHLLGNHLLENAVALCYVGSCFAGPDAARWKRAGAQLLRAELAEQVLADGGHFERSPMYHARLLAALTALLDTGDATLRAIVLEPAERVARALVPLCHPDGGLALLNDSAMNVVPEAPDLLEAWSRAAGRPAPAPSDGVFALPDTGYYGVRDGGDYLVCDAGPVGPDYIPGHAHGDIFSFELSLGGRRVVVDTGVHDYEVSELRRLCRSTRAHNTVEVEGEDQCEFWAAFRVARRGRPRDVAFAERPGGFSLEGWHDGYERLPGRPRHRRRFAWHESGVLMVADRVDASRAVETASRLHLHPDCAVERAGDRLVRIGHPGGSATVCFAGEGDLRVEDSSYCPELGLALGSRVLVFAARGDGVATGFCVARNAVELRYDLERGATVNGREIHW
jgi:uncharacterized heparinase superfamily protein